MEQLRERREFQNLKGLIYFTDGYGICPGRPPAYQVIFAFLEEDENRAPVPCNGASNAFVLLTSDFFPFSKTQCAVFKGTERSVFLDKREFTGPIYEQIEEATTFVLRNIRLGAMIDGLVRKESYELPIEAIREMIINAHCHRNLADDSCVQVALYDDRLEVTSPGGLYNGMTYEELMNGHSKLRNRTIANVLGQMGFVESWGTGISRIIKAAEDYGLPVPEFQVFDDMLRVNLFRNSMPIKKDRNGGEASEKHRRSIGEASEKN
nr:ATP-binding protein [uncultured Acetatifactor sp.]